MEIRPSPQNHGAEVSAVAKDKSTQTGRNHGQDVAVVASQKTAAHSSRALMNAAILSAQQEVNLSAADEPMVLLYRAAIEAINEELAPAMGEQAIQRLADEGVDTSPEATAGRIVDFATQFFALHQSQNASQSFDEQLSGFMDIIGGAIDQGFKEARDILSGLKVLEGDIAAGVDKTYELVQQGLKDFAGSFSTDESPEQTE